MRSKYVQVMHLSFQPYPDGILRACQSNIIITGTLACEYLCTKEVHIDFLNKRKIILGLSLFASRNEHVDAQL